MKIIVTSGAASGPTPISAFDHALISAGIANYNLLYLSSIIPPGATIERRRFVAPPAQYGHRLFVVLSRQDARIHGESAWAGLGWVQAPDSGKGLLVEVHGTSRQVVERGIERSLTAMAFLFAIFTARPSPFYLMDEVEPALDDVNLHRFLRLIDGFANDSQVLIVTHQKRTMEIAGMMYGVSLSRDGTTKVVCQQMEEPRIAHEEQARLEAERERAEASVVVTQTSADEEPDALEVPKSMPETEPVH